MWGLEQKIENYTVLLQVTARYNSAQTVGSKWHSGGARDGTRTDEEYNRMATKLYKKVQRISRYNAATRITALFMTVVPTHRKQSSHGTTGIKLSRFTTICAHVQC